MGHCTATCNDWVRTWFAYTKCLLCCILHKDIQARPSFFVETTVSGFSCLDMFENWLFLNWIKILMAASSSKMGLRLIFIRRFAKFWIACFLCDGSDIMRPMTIRCYVKDIVCVPPLPRNLQELQNWIVAAFGGETTDKLQRVWQERYYQRDVCCMTWRAHFEGL